MSIFHLKKKISLRSVIFRKERFLLLFRLLLGIFCIFMTWWFFHHEKDEIKQVPDILSQSHIGWLVFGIFILILFLLAQGFMYQTSFRAVDAKVSLSETIPLFLKRNFISVFLPAGGVSSLAFYNRPIERKGIKRTQIHIASAIYGFSGIFSVIIVAIPAFILTTFYSSLGWAAWLSLLLVCLLAGLIILVYLSINKRHRTKQWISRKVPVFQLILEEFQSDNLKIKQVYLTILLSVLIEICGIAHLYIAMEAFGFGSHFMAAVMGYIVAIIFMLISPFLRGLGAVELSTGYLLVQFGLEQSAALTATLLFRIFEFWLPLALGLLTFLHKWNKIILRILPALLLILLGAVDILSVLTPEINFRLHLLLQFLPLGILQVSDYFVFAAGVYMILTGVFLFKGLRNAWIFAIILTLCSILGNISKGFDYEEALFSAFVLLVLLLTRKQYIRKSSSKSVWQGIFIALTGIGFTIIYGILGFYFLNKSHFHIDFSLSQSVFYSLKSFFLLDTGLSYQDTFGRMFVVTIHLLGATCLSFLVYALVRPFIWDQEDELMINLKRGKELTQKYGNSNLDYFKYYPDKNLFFTENNQSFLAFKISGNHAIVLEKPVAVSIHESLKCMDAFESFCKDSGLYPIYYRVAEKDIQLFNKNNKKKFYLGQEAVVDLQKFTLAGKDKKSMRNALNKIQSTGFVTNIYAPPLSANLLDQLDEISTAWLVDNKASETAFSNGLFLRETLADTTVITLENATTNEMVAFLNIIPDYAPDEGTYDLIRKKPQAPNGSMDALIIKMFDYFKESGVRFCNLGMVPMSGVTAPATIGERAIKMAYNNIPTFSHYKGLRDYKEKFQPAWSNVYLLFDDEYQLIAIPRVLKKIMRP